MPVNIFSRLFHLYNWDLWLIYVGRGDNLDLNLWISPTSADPRENDNSKNSYLHFATSELPDVKRLKVFWSFPSVLFIHVHVCLAMETPLLGDLIIVFFFSFFSRVLPSGQQQCSSCFSWSSDDIQEFYNLVQLVFWFYTKERGRCAFSNWMDWIISEAYWQNWYWMPPWQAL